MRKACKHSEAPSYVCKKKYDWLYTSELRKIRKLEETNSRNERLLLTPQSGLTSIRLARGSGALLHARPSGPSR